jgi:hypothetical protein
MGVFKKRGAIFQGSGPETLKGFDPHVAIGSGNFSLLSCLSCFQKKSGTEFNFSVRE